MKYRDHRGGLAESMITVREFNNLSQLKVYLLPIWSKKIMEIKFEYACFDERIGWKTYYVCVRFKYEREFRVVGMSDGRLKK